MNTELNKNILKQAITRLPEYQPPNEIWAAIDTNLDFKEKLDALPEYTPAVEVWEKINHQLLTKRLFK